MNRPSREAWSRHVDQIIRSRHYTWLGEGLGGEAPPEALSSILIDIMHICQRQEIPFPELLESCQQQYVREREDERATSAIN